MSELARQLLSTKLNQVAGESAGHNNESAIYEIVFDNEIDVDAKRISLLVCLTNLCWAILENGPGIENINNLWGAGDGVKIKNGNKIGNKLSGEFAAAAFLEANKTMYFSRCNENTDKRKHQQLNAQFHKMIKVIKTPGIDMVEADNIILSGPNKLVRIPEPDSDKFDSDNVEYVKGLFKNNEHILSYFNSNQSGMLKVFVYEEGNTYKFTSLIQDFPKILDKVEFISYNTVQGFKDDRIFEYINIDAEDNRVINEEACKENFILGRSAIADDDEDKDEDEDGEYVENPLFGDISLNKVLYLSNSIYEFENKKYNKCEIINFEEKFFIGESIKKHLDDAALDAVTKSICKESNFKSVIPILLSFVDENETKTQLEKMNGTEINNLTHESLKQVYVYFNGRFLGKCKLSLPGIQERSLPNFRIVICLNDYSSKLINIRAQKSSVSLETADKIIIKTLNDIIKPVLNCFGSSSKLINFTQGIDDWRKHKRSVLTSLGIQVPAPPAAALPAPVQQMQAPVVEQVVATIQPVVPPIPPPTERAATIVLSSLTKTQTIQQLRRLRVKANNVSNFRTKAEKKKVYSVLNNIEKEIVIDEELIIDKIDYLIELLEGCELTNSEKVKQAAPLQEL